MAPVDDDERDDEDTPERKVGLDGWMDLMDGKIRKRTLVEGTGEQPEMKQDVRCSYDVSLASVGPVGGKDVEVLQRYTDVRYRIGEGEAVPMLELCLRHMRVGEEAEVFGMANMAWGPSGLRAASSNEQAIPPDSDIRMRVVLLEVIGSSGDAEHASWNEMIQEVTWRKTNGNDHFRRQEYGKAARSYKAGVEVFSAQGFDPPDHVPEKDRAAAKAAAMSLVTDCGANLAEVHLQQGNALAAKETAKASLEMWPEHVKCLYRAARACLILDDYEECEELLRRGLKVEPSNAAMKQVEAELTQKKKQYASRSKKLAGRLFEGLDYPDEPPNKGGKAGAHTDELPGWIEWAWEGFKEWFDWKIAAIMVASIVVMAAILVVTPHRYWPGVLISFALGVPVSIGLFMGMQEDQRRIAEGGGGAKKKKTD